MEDRETARMRKYWESKTTRIMMATVPHVTTGFGLRKFQADGFLLTRVYKYGVTEFCAVATIMCGCTVWYSICVTVVASTILMGGFKIFWCALSRIF